jgi:hypothetical protein
MVTPRVELRLRKNFRWVVDGALDPRGPSLGALEEQETRANSRAIPTAALASRGSSWQVARPVMANRAIWNMRKRHEWLATPLKKKRVKRATRVRCGLQDAVDRKAEKSGDK